MNKIRNIQARTHAALLSRDARATTMLEYALMAAVVVGLAVILIGPLRSKFQSIVDGIKGVDTAPDVSTK